MSRLRARPFLLATWVALAAGLTEVALRAVERQIGRFAGISQQVVWMAPLVLVVAFAAVALLQATAGRRWPAAAGMRALTLVPVFLGALSVGLLQPWLHWWAVALIALGIGIRAAAFAATREGAVLRVVRRTLPILAAVVLALALVVNGRLLLAERRALAALGPVRAGAPNVLLIIWDTVRAGSVSLYGNPRRTTPTLEALAARGVTFDRAIAPASYTLPTHASLFTGRDPHQLSATWLVPLDDATPTLAEALAARGYRTAGFSANRIYATWEHGLQRGFTHWEDYAVSVGEMVRSASLTRRLAGMDGLRALLDRHDEPGRRSAADIRGAFLAWLDRGERGRPFFAFLNIYDAHEPYLPPPPFDTLFGWTPGTDPRAMRTVRDEALATRYRLTAEQTARQRDQYEGAIAYVDADLRVLLAALERRGLLANTVVIVASDHGEAFGEHRTYSHGNDLYQNVTHVPLVIVYPPAVPAGVRIDGFVTLRDVPATVGELAGALDGDWPLGGRSLARHWRAAAGAAPSDTVLAEIDRLPRGGEDWYAVTRGDVRSVIADPHQLILTGDSVELYDLRADPAQRQDLAQVPDRRALRDSLTALLARLRADAVPAKR